MSEHGFHIEPGRLYLMHTRERICTRKYVPIIDGKSSIGRLGVLVHVTAGYGDPGFDGQYTLEVTSIAHTVVLYPGMRIAQMRFHAIQGDVADYQERGSYTGADAVGPVRSASWRQFR
jgi:dCTP deaminase